MTIAHDRRVYYDPYDADISADPFPTFRRLRDEAPLYHNDRFDVWALSRHAAPLKSLPGDLRDGVRVTDRGRVVLDERLEAALCARTLEVFEPLYAAGRLTCFLLQLTPAFNPAEHELP